MVSTTENSISDQQLFTDAMARISAWRQIEGIKADGSRVPLIEAPQEVKDAYLVAIRAISKLKPDDTDPWMLGKIQLIIRKSTRYIIYLDQNFEIQWWWTSPPADLDNLTLLQTHITQIETDSNFLMEKVGKPWQFPSFFRNTQADADSATLSLPFQASSELIGIRAMLGEAAAIAMNGGKQEDWGRVIDEARKQVTLAKDRRCRPWFIFWFLVPVILANFLPHFSLSCWPDVTTLCMQKWGQGHAHAMLALGAGTIGALVSAISRTQQIGLDPRSGQLGLFTEALSRAILGATAGALTSLAIDGHLILGQELVNTPALRFFLAFAAGFSERVLPALIGKAETTITGEVTKKS
ncbi:hypothetical protein ACH5Y9_23845 [Methylomonas sp. BW4-1]|uniref:Uncharacterized protein n=1 Tax=Methylomonas defluvii TaxID=3045149 RepID=A0ABU4UJP9_9GAMM|nr:hypothetical protein [Methylomonas sp. OY6]MDX8129055.1 hypothetical protein [Methylomonas sp. OY6]